ncbi:MAG: AAA family ATPase [Acidimicrobiales bacterium]
MAKKRRVYRCSACGAEAAAWTGRCNGCGGWATVGEAVGERPFGSASALRPLASFAGDSALPSPTGFDEVDRVLGGGLVPGAVTLLHGEPGIGKSTLALQIAGHVASTGASVVLVSGKRPLIRSRHGRGELRLSPERFRFSTMSRSTTSWPRSRSERPQLMVIDSIQTLTSADVEAAAGSTSQVRECANRLTAAAKRAQVSLVLIGHVTKDGGLAGPRLLEHVVDTVLSFGGDRDGELRYLRAMKHRYGATSEVGLFEMTAVGLAPVSDPSRRFLADRLAGVPGSVVVPVLDGHRPVLVEVQALVAPGTGPGTSTTAQGVAVGRLKLVLAVLERRVGLSMAASEVFCSAAGGAAVDDPGADLGIALALASSRTGVGLAPDAVACGEVGLAGEIRRAGQLERRMHEAFRLGFRQAIVPMSAPTGPTGLRLLRVETLADALSLTNMVVPA